MPNDYVTVSPTAPTYTPHDSTSASGTSGAGIVASSEVDVTVLNTTTESALATLATPTGLAAGDRLIFRAAGDALNNSGSSVNATWRFKLGATTVMASSGTVVATGTNRRKWTLEVVIALESTSAQRVAATFGLSASLAASFATGTPIQGYGIGTATEDLTSTKNAIFTVEWASAAATIDFVCKSSSLQLVKKVG